MPEMPEVEIIRRGLVDQLKNRQIVDMEVLLPRQIKWPSVENFQSMIIGRTVVDFKRKGKYLLLELDSGDLVVIHRANFEEYLVGSLGGASVLD